MTMISKIVLATTNQHKKKEIQFFLAPLGIEVITLSNLQILIPESVEKYKTYRENAEAKCRYVANYTPLPILADDSGLEITALEGRPGIVSARYANTGKDKDNRDKVLHELSLSQTLDRSASFVCVLCFLFERKIYFFEGHSSGKILEEEMGNPDFGYDCIFLCDSYQKSYGMLSFEEKMNVCHRGNAMRNLMQWLQTIKIPKVGLEPTKGCPH
jgi:XTP/dITP diphosphohydrolase